jgi:hypothetical protein
MTLPMKPLSNLFKPVKKISFHLSLIFFSFFLLKWASANEYNLKSKPRLGYKVIEEDNWRILQQEITDENKQKFTTIAAIWILDKNFPVQVVTLDNLTLNDAARATYKEGDEIVLRGTDSYFPTGESLSTNRYENDFPTCNADEFRMFARIDSDLNYQGVVEKNKIKEPKPWFSFGNVVCVKIIRDELNDTNQI